MADTAALNPMNPVQAIQIGGPALEQSGSGSGGSVVAGRGTDDGQGQRTTDALLKLGSNVLAGKIKEEQQKQFFSGVQRAASGEALEDILKNQPWYTGIFGPSSAALGARAYSTQMKVAEFGAQMEKEMPTLAKLGPEAVVQRAMEAYSGLKTGDDMVDGAIQMSFVDQLQPLLKRHAKEAYIYQQKEASAAQVSAWGKMFEAHQARASAKGDAFSQEDVDADWDRVLMTLQPFADQPPESFEKNVAMALQGAAAAGSFHVINRMEKEGFVAMLPPETQAQLKGVFARGAKDALNKAMPKYAYDLSMIAYDTAQDPRKAAERMAAFNAKVAEQEGIPMQYAQLFPPEQMDTFVGGILKAQAAQAAQGYKETAEEKRQRQLAMATSMLTSPGAVGRSVATDVFPANVAEEAADAAWNQELDPAKRAAILNARGAGSFTAIKEQIAALSPYKTDKDTVGVQHAAAIYANLDDATRPSYFDAEERNFFDRYNKAVRVGVPPEQAFAASKIAAPLAGSQIDPKDKDAVSKAIRTEVENRTENFLGWNQLDDNSMRIMEAVVAKEFNQGKQMHGVQAATQRAITVALNDGLEIIGKHAVIGGKPGQTPLAQMLLKGEGNMGAKATAQVFEQLVEEKVKAVGGNLDSYVLYRLADVKGDARYMIESIDGEGALYTTTIMGRELRGRTVEQRKVEASPDAKPFIGYGRKARKE